MPSGHLALPDLNVCACWRGCRDWCLIFIFEIFITIYFSERFIKEWKPESNFCGRRKNKETQEEEFWACVHCTTVGGKGKETSGRESSGSSMYRLKFKILFHSLLLDTWLCCKDKWGKLNQLIKPNYLVL